MNPIRQWIEDLLACARKKAAITQIKRELDEQLFLFAIEIGRGRALIQQAVTKTQTTRP